MQGLLLPQPPPMVYGQSLNNLHDRKNGGKGGKTICLNILSANDWGNGHYMIEGYKYWDNFQAEIIKYFVVIHEAQKSLYQMEEVEYGERWISIVSNEKM